MCAPSVFTMDQSGIWAVAGNELLQIDFDLKTNLSLVLPLTGGAPISSICEAGNSVWMGTDGEGLIEFEKSSHQCHQLTEKDGLMMNRIACLSAGANAIWIGYGAEWGDGGLGRLNVGTRQFLNFARSLHELDASVVESTDLPPRQAVVSALSVSDDEVWFVTSHMNINRVRHYNDKDRSWTGGPANCTSMALDQKRIVQAWYEGKESGKKSGHLGIRVMDFKLGKWQELTAFDTIPSGVATAIALDGDNLWVGGMGYIALIDVNQDKLLKIAWITAHAVDQIQIGGGYLWAKYDCLLHRTSLSSIR
jgi:hypothetical protein